MRFLAILLGLILLSPSVLGSDPAPAVAGVPDVATPDPCVPTLNEGGACAIWKRDASFSTFGSNLGLALVEAGPVAYALTRVVDAQLSALLVPTPSTTGVTAYDVASGRELWRATLTGAGTDLGAAAGVVYASTNDVNAAGVVVGTLVALDADTGVPLWTHVVDTGNANRIEHVLTSVHGVSIAVSDAIHSAGASVLVRSFTLTGALRWEAAYDSGSPDDAMGFIEIAGRPTLIGRSWSAGTGPAFALALDPASGDVAWLTNFDPAAGAGTWILDAADDDANGRAYFAGSSLKNVQKPDGRWCFCAFAHLWIVDAATGAISTTYSPGDLDRSFNDVAVDTASSRVYLAGAHAGTRFADVSAVTLDGAPLWTRPMDDVYSSPRVLARPGGGALVLAERYYETGIGPATDLTITALDASGAAGWDRRVQAGLGHDVLSAAVIVEGGDTLLATVSAPRAFVPLVAGWDAATYAFDVRDAAQIL